MSSSNINNNNVNYGGKIGSPPSFTKDFQNNLNYPIRKFYFAAYAKAFTPYTPIGTYIKYFNNYDRNSTAFSLSSYPN